MPFYQFNNFTGRLRESKHLQPLYPISANRLESSEPPKMIWDTIKTKPVTVAANTRAASQNSLPPKMLKTMAEYQKNLEAPVYLIKGAPDKILYGITCVGITIGMGMVIEFLVRRGQFFSK